MVLATSIALAGALLNGCGSGAGQPPSSPGIERYPGVRDLHGFAERYRAKHRLPALGVGIIHHGTVVGLGMAGERASGSGDWATLDDGFDVGSIAKSVTATLAAMLVQDDVIRWESTPADVFPEARDRFHAAYAGATLERLLRHRAGVGHELNRNDRWAGWQRDRAALSPLEQRRAFAFATLEAPPRSAPGTATFYTSDGYVIAGSLLERAAGRDFETQVRTRLFEPLGLTSMAYGGEPASVSRVLGHEPRWLGPSRPVPDDAAEYGTRPFGVPAGFLRASVPDLLRYVDFHLQGARGLSSLLDQPAFLRLHRPLHGQPYGLGWQVEVRVDAAGQPIEHSVHHGGYSGRSRANLWFVPETGWGTAIVTNDGRGDEAITADVFYGLLQESGVRLDNGGR